MKVIAPCGGFNFGCLPNSYLATLSLPLLRRTERENKMENLVNQHKDREITHQLSSQEKTDSTWGKII